MSTATGGAPPPASETAGSSAGWWSGFKRRYGFGRGLPYDLRLGLGMAVTAGVIVLFSFAFWVLGFTELGSFGIDLRAAWSQPADGPQVVVVGITARDDSIYFGGGARPYRPAVIDSIVRKARLGGAAAIGVDIDTEHPDFAAHPGIRELADAPEVVWAAGRECVGADDGVARPAGGECEEGEWRVRPPLGGVNAVDGPFLGLARLELDRDLTVRRFRRQFPTSVVVLPTFATAVVEAAYPGHLEWSDAPFWIRFQRPDRIIQYSLDDFLNAEVDGFTSEFGPVRGRIVLIGGAARQDYWMTPLGYRRGIDVWAHIVATEAGAIERGTTLRPVPTRWARWGIEFLGAVAAVFLVRMLTLSLVAFWGRWHGGPPEQRGAKQWTWGLFLFTVGMCVGVWLFAHWQLGEAAWWYLGPVIGSGFVLGAHEGIMRWLVGPKDYRTPG